MHYNDVGYTLRFELKNIDLLRFSVDREYFRVISPFTRLYLILEGDGWINIEGEKVILEAGYLYLIPSFKSCSYHFSVNLVHYYIHTSMLLINGLNVFHLFKTSYKVKAMDLDHRLFERLLILNPNIGIPHHDPGVYQKKVWMNPDVVFRSFAHYNETRGILDQLFSRFIVDDETISINDLLGHNFGKVIEYIQVNLNDPISVEALAGIACLSRDHFIRVFKKKTGVPPAAYIVGKRIEKAQFLLLTTDLPIKSIIEESGFRSLAYFSRTFRKYTSYSPVEYRKFRQ